MDPSPESPPAPPRDEPNAFVVPGFEEDEDAARIVREELRLLEIVQRAIGNAKDDAPAEGDPTLAAALAEDDRRLLELRDLAASAKPEDLPALFEQMHTLGALRAHRGKGLVGSVDRKS